MAYCTVIGSVYYRKTLVATLLLIQVCMFGAMCSLFLFCHHCALVCVYCTATKWSPLKQCSAPLCSTSLCSQFCAHQCKSI